uniref:Uncharacterized protein n=1 Tax=Megaselia scalaris TaxID=36166 RepID=T1GP78_MEGSC
MSTINSTDYGNQHYASDKKTEKISSIPGNVMEKYRLRLEDGKDLDKRRTAAHISVMSSTTSIPGTIRLCHP